MKKEDFNKIERYMLSCMKDGASDKEHIYRVLYNALEIAAAEENVDYDVLIAACLLHDIGSENQTRNQSLSHAAVGAQMAYLHLVSNRWDNGKANSVAACIKAHSCSSKVEPETLEAKILFDADKLDAVGALGIMRKSLYQNRSAIPIYTLDKKGNVLDGIKDIRQSFFKTYRSKIEPLYGRFYTTHGKFLSIERQATTRAFFDSLLKETQMGHRTGKRALDAILCPTTKKEGKSRGNTHLDDLKSLTDAVAAASQPDIIRAIERLNDEPLMPLDVITPQKKLENLVSNYEWLDAFLMSKPCAEKDFKEEWQWNRYLVHGKMFAAICYNKNGVPIITLKCMPEYGAMLRKEFAEINEGFYMNKQQWISVSLVGSISEKLMREMADKSYRLVAILR